MLSLGFRGSTSRTHMGGFPNSQAKGKQYGCGENFTGNTAMWLPKKKKQSIVIAKHLVKYGAERFNGLIDILTK